MKMRAAQSETNPPTPGSQGEPGGTNEIGEVRGASDFENQGGHIFQDAASISQGKRRRPPAATLASAHAV